MCDWKENHKSTGGITQSRKLIEWEATHHWERINFDVGVAKTFYILNWAMVFWSLSKAGLKQEQIAEELPLMDEMGLSALKAVKLLMQ